MASHRKLALKFLVLWLCCPSLNGAEPGITRLRLGYFPNLTHGQALYARATGELETHLGIRVEWTAFNAGPTAIEAVFGNAVDATFVGAPARLSTDTFDRTAPASWSSRARRAAARGW